MKKEMKEIIFGTAIAIVGGVMALTTPIRAVAEEQNESAVVIEQSEISWADFHSVPGQCKMKFPAIPEHVSEKMTVPEEDYEMSYDAYIAASERDSMFMLLIAQYPEFVDESYAQMSLETFLNGILTHNPSNQLIFADLSLVQGHEALDFFIRTGSVYFKGRAVMVKNSLYLMAMECEMQNYDEGHFTTFVESFELIAITDEPKDAPKAEITLEIKNEMDAVVDQEVKDKIKNGEEVEQKAFDRWYFDWTSMEKGYEGKPERRRGVDVIHFKDGKIIEKLTYSKTTVEIDGKRVKLCPSSK